MSLLEKATLITTPTAHSNGTLHSIKGGAVADFDVVRGSAATRVNAEGLIEDVRVVSNIYSSNFISGVDGWTAFGLGNIDGGISIGSEDDSLKYTVSSAVGDTRSFLKLNTKTIGNQYKLTFRYYIPSTNPNLSSVISSESGIRYFVVDAWTTVTEYFTASSVDTKLSVGDANDYLSPAAIGETAYIKDVSIVEVTDATNIPRIDYTTGEGVVLLEPQSTNIAKYSEQLNTAPNVSDNASYTSSYYVAPNGLTEAPKFEETTANGRHGFYQYQAVTSGSYSVSIYTKQFDRRYISLQSDIAGGSQFTYFDLQTGTVVSEGAGWSATINAVGDNGWYRLTATCTAVAGTRFVIFGGSLDGLSNTYVGDGSEFTFWGLQLEALPYATSYIPTSGAIATRLADSVTGAGDATTFNSTEGVLYIEGSALVETATSNRHLTISDGTNDNRFYFYYTASGQFGFAVFVGNVLQANIKYDGVIVNNSKVACKYKENDYALWVDGVEVGTDTSASVWSNGTLNRLDFSEPSRTDGKLQGKVKALAVFNEALTDSELECLTKI